MREWKHHWGIHRCCCWVEDSWLLAGIGVVRWGIQFLMVKWSGFGSVEWNLSNSSVIFLRSIGNVLPGLPGTCHFILFWFILLLIQIWTPGFAGIQRIKIFDWYNQFHLVKADETHATMLATFLCEQVLTEDSVIECHHALFAAWKGQSSFIHGSNASLWSPQDSWA